MTPGPAGDILLVFLKCPRPGAVKTRLIPHLGAEGAAHLYRLIAEEEVRRTASREGEYERLFFYAGTDDRREIEGWIAGEAWLPQEGPDLGARMAAAFDVAFQRGARRVAIIGGDVPWLSREDVLAAFRALDDHDVVLGPCTDGGYYLLALSQPRPELFRGIAWGTSAVLADTLVRARGLRTHLLAPLRDLDTLDDIAATWLPLRPLLPEHLARRIDQALSPPG